VGLRKEHFILEKNEEEESIKENRWVVNDVINKYTHIMDRTELEGAGLQGLIEGIRKYKPDRGTKMSTYVRYWVRARVLAAVYENRLVHIPWNKINDYNKLVNKTNNNTSLTGSRTKSEEWSTVYQPKAELSLNFHSPYSDHDDDDYQHSQSKIEFASSLSSQDLHIMQEKELESHIDTALEQSNLSEVELTAVKLRFGLNKKETENMTYANIADRIGMSTMGAQKVVVRGLAKLKNNDLIKELFV
jgi:RNA polymerase sigma factor (sigma-70 family)